MAHVVFYEKPGCGGNARQKALLRASGHTLEVRDLLTEAWSAATLAPFFGDKPVAEWLNPAAPRIKSGEVDAGALSAEQALAMMLAEPLLIRRPLMQVGERRASGFDAAFVEAWIGLAPAKESVSDTCSRGDTRESCAP
jgi:nitrogenase-associated protein